MKALLQLEPFQTDASAASDFPKPQHTAPAPPTAAKPQPEVQKEEAAESEAASGFAFLTNMHPPLSDPEQAETPNNRIAQPARQILPIPRQRFDNAPASPGNLIHPYHPRSVSKLDALMAQVSELLIAKLHAEQRLNQINQLQEQVAEWQKEWLLARSAITVLRRAVATWLPPIHSIARKGAEKRQMHA
jgi:chemotaxis protein histidine kinase CheA